MSERMKILHITWSGDLAGMLWDIVRIQHNDPEKVIHVCFGTKGEGIFYDKIRGLGINPFVLGMKKKYGFVSNVLGALRLRHILKNNSYDVIQLQEAILPFPFLTATGSNNQKCTILHNHGEFNSLTNSGLAGLGQWIKRVAYRVMAGPRIDRLICNSQYTVARTPISNRYASKITVLHNGIDMSAIRAISKTKSDSYSRLRKELGLSPDDLIYAVVARLVTLKRIDRFIRAFCLARKNVSAYAIIVGDGPSRTSLEGIVKRLSGDDHIRFLGFRNDALEIMAGSDLLVLPTGGEAFGNVAIEALSLGVPVVIFDDAGGPLEFITDGRNGFVVADEPALAGILENFASNAQMRSKFQGSSLVDRSRFDIEEYVGAIDRMYQEIFMKQNTPDSHENIIS